MVSFPPLLLRRIIPLRLACPRLAARLVAVLGVCWIVGCGAPERSENYVARVGTATLSHDEVDAVLADMGPVLDTTSARTQVIDQWVTSELLHQEALRLDLSGEPAVRRRLEESQRAVLVDALIARLYEESVPPPTAQEQQAYYDRNRERLRLREPFVRVRYLETASADSAATARRLLQRAQQTGQADSVWAALTDRFALDPDGARSLALTYVPSSRLFADRPEVAQTMRRLRPGELSAVLPVDSVFAVLHLAGRAPAGSIPEQAWIRDEIQRQLLIDARKQLYARHVQRLRTQAQARGAVEVR